MSSLPPETQTSTIVPKPASVVSAMPPWVTALLAAIATLGATTGGQTLLGGDLSGVLQPLVQSGIEAGLMNVVVGALIIVSAIWKPMSHACNYTERYLLQRDRCIDIQEGRAQTKQASLDLEQKRLTLDNRREDRLSGD